MTCSGPGVGLYLEGQIEIGFDQPDLGAKFLHDCFQFLAFLSVLTEGHIGLSGWKLFYINKKTIKTVINSSSYHNVLNVDLNFLDWWS